ncbi:MAG: Flp pilus assembly complex ATPase component TadA [Dehalococcoidales bacterium]|nr:Flp pilus assembly complex ATPase component TadA [Dehalococcoidales bacterium]
MTLTNNRPKGTLGESLVQRQIITAEQLEQAQEKQKEQGGKLSEILVNMGFVKVEELASFLSIMWNVPLIDLKTHVVQPEALALIPEELARKHLFIPLQIIGDSLMVVMADPDDYITIGDIFARTNMKVQVAFASAADIRRAINIYYRATDEIQEKVSESLPIDIGDRGSAVDFSVETPITESLDLLIEQAIRDRASDIHLEPQNDRLRIRYRIDGVLYDMNSVPISVHTELASRIKILAEMDVTRSKQAQDGQFSIKIGDKSIDIRVASADTIHGERITLRLLDKSVSLFTLPELGFLPDTLKKYRALLHYPFGMVLVGGPTGSGKTTTLYTSINEIDRKRYNIMTIEDPVEYQFENITQSQVDPKTGITFASGLRASLRQDPDVILVGEIRDKETAITAVQAALTGHLVFSSIHANDAVSMITRLLDLGVEPGLISSTLIALLAQRMVRRICTNCRVAAPPNAVQQEIYRKEMGQELTSVYKGTGCHLCGQTGYMGRIGIFEMLVMSEEIQKMLISDVSIGTLREEAIREGIYTMKHDGLLKVKEGITTFEEVMNSVFTIG